MVDMVSTITARELRNVRLTTTYLSAGYNIVEVNGFFERCADALDGKAEMSPEEVEQQMFTTVRFTNGYDIGQIDDPLDRIAETLRHLPVEEPVQPVQPVQPMQPVQPAAQPVQPAQQPIDAQQPAQLPIDSQQTQFVQPTPQTQPAQQPVPQQTQQPVQQTQPASAATGKGAIGAVLHEGNLFYGKFQWNGHQHVLITTKGQVLEIGPTDVAGFILQ